MGGDTVHGISLSISEHYLPHDTPQFDGHRVSASKVNLLSKMHY